MSSKILTMLSRYSAVNLFGKGGLKSCRNFATNVGDSNIRSFNPNEGIPHRWKRSWFLAMKRKAEIEGPSKPIPRSNLRNWNYEAEIAAFKLRLGIRCPEHLLNTVFHDSISTADESIQNNKELCNNGKQFIGAFLSHYINIVFPKLPLEAKQAVENYLTSSSVLSHLATNLGFQDFLQTVNFPPNDDAMRNCFLAFLEAINICEGPVSAGRFILDFVIPFLIGKDILDDLWQPKDPMSLLSAEMKRLSRPLPEARLSRQSGINTVMPLFFVSLFSGEEFLAESGGESVPLAEADAAKQVLKQMYNIHSSSNTLPMGVSIENNFLSQLFEPLLASNEENQKIINNSKVASITS